MPDTMGTLSEINDGRSAESRALILAYTDLGVECAAKA